MPPCFRIGLWQPEYTAASVYDPLACVLSCLCTPFTLSKCTQMAHHLTDWAIHTHKTYYKNKKTIEWKTTTVSSPSADRNPNRRIRLVVKRDRKKKNIKNKFSRCCEKYDHINSCNIILAFSMSTPIVCCCLHIMEFVWTKLSVLIVDKICDLFHFYLFTYLCAQIVCLKTVGPVKVHDKLTNATCRHRELRELAAVGFSSVSALLY